MNCRQIIRLRHNLPAADESAPQRRGLLSVEAHLVRRTTLCRNYNDLRFLKQFA